MTEQLPDLDRPARRAAARLARRDHRRRGRHRRGQVPAGRRRRGDDRLGLLRHGPGYARVLVDELSDWMARKGFRTVAELRGLLSVPAGGDEAGYERAGYVTALQAANSHAGPW